MLTANGSVTALIAITRQNGYAGDPQITTSLGVPAGVTISYDNGGIESAATGNHEISWGPVTQVNALEYSQSGFTSSRHATRFTHRGHIRGVYFFFSLII